MNTLDAARRAVGRSWGIPWRSVRVRILRSEHGRSASTLLVGTSAQPDHIRWQACGIGRREILHVIALVAHNLIPPRAMR